MVRFVILAILLVFAPTRVMVEAKISSGDFRLSGVSTEHILTSFLVVPKGAELKLEITAPVIYRSRLTFRAYDDTLWSRFKREPTCLDKSRLTIHRIPIEFETSKVGEARATVEFKVPEDNRLTARNKYWYFVIDDCSLEEYFHDNKVPTFHYNLSIQNYRGRLGRLKTHMDAQQMDYPEWHALSCLICLVVLAYLGTTAVWRLNTGAYEVHIAVVWVFAATTCEMWESIFEIAHLQIYHENGRGSYMIDALAAYAAALCDSAVVILMLSMAAGWTLPPVNAAGIVNANAIQNAMQKLSGSPNNIKLIGAVLLFHMIVAQLGRMTSDDSESYHDLEHWPGRILVWSRVLGGLVFQGTVRQTIQRRQQNADLVKFYNKFSVAGTSWFLGLPAISWFSSIFISTYWRGMFHTVAATLFQSSSLLLLAWLVTTKRTAFHKNSRMGTAPKEDSLTDRLAASSSPSSTPIVSSWRFGSKSKLRFD